MSRKTIDRRSFLTHGLAGFSLAATAPHFLNLSSRVFADAGGGLDARVLVVLQLSGGNDGLSTVVPYADAAYYRARRQTALSCASRIRSRAWRRSHTQRARAAMLASWP